jgi:hypothetical protein
VETVGKADSTVNKPVTALDEQHKTENKQQNRNEHFQ